MIICIDFYSQYYSRLEAIARLFAHMISEDLPFQVE